MSNGDLILKESTIKMLQKMIDNRPRGDEKYDEMIDHCFRIAIELVSAAPSVESVSDAYKRGFDDCKRAYEIELARSAENSNAKTQNSNQETQKSNGDLIYRADAIEAVKGAYEMDEFYKVISEDIIDVLSALPSAEAVQGEWIPFDLTFGRSIWVCSACDNGTYVPCDAFTQKPIYDYCPNCGAKMNKVGDDE